LIVSLEGCWHSWCCPYSHVGHFVCLGDIRSAKLLRRAYDVLHNTMFTLYSRLYVACTIGSVNCANEPSQAVLERSSQDAHDVIRLMRSKATVWTVGDVARLIDFLHSYLFIILFFLP